MWRCQVIFGEVIKLYSFTKEAIIDIKLSDVASIKQYSEIDNLNVRSKDSDSIQTAYKGDDVLLEMDGGEEIRGIFEEVCGASVYLKCKNFNIEVKQSDITYLWNMTREAWMREQLLTDEYY